MYYWKSPERSKEVSFPKRSFQTTSRFVSPASPKKSTQKEKKSVGSPVHSYKKLLASPKRLLPQGFQKSIFCGGEKKDKCSHFCLASQKGLDSNLKTKNFPDGEESRKMLYALAHIQNELGRQLESKKLPRAPLENEGLKTKSGGNVFSETVSTNASFRKPQALKLSSFKVLKKLGTGKFGEVFLAQHLQTGFLCALKQIYTKNLDKSLQNQLIREIKIQSFLNHPNIVKMYSFFKDQDCMYLVLEPCTSGNLYGAIKKNIKMEQKLAKVVIKQICQGLDYLHDQKIIHRDLKPQNILYQYGMMKICDFGWSVDSQLMRDTFCGTPLYVSPEILSRKHYDHKIDVWSLGVLAFQLLVGTVPFEVYSERDFLKIINKEAILPSSVSLTQQAENFIKECMNKDPRLRPSSSQLLDHHFLRKQNQSVSFQLLF